MLGLFRSLVFVPGNNPRFLEKARSLECDIVCLDLEDSVPHAEKKTARGLISDALQDREYSASVFVRTNAPGTEEIADDLHGTLGPGLDGVVIPKVDSAEQMRRIEGIVDDMERKKGLSGLKLIPSIESAAGVVNCHEIASSSERIVAVVFGVFDLLNDMGIEYTKQPPGAEYARAKIPLDASAAGVAAIDAIWQDIEDSDGLEHDCRAGKDLGYAGKSVIHPSQIPAVHRTFHPSGAEIRWAQKVCRAYASSVERGRGATTLDGKMIDEVHYKQARALLDLSGAGGAK